jgi:hypothetical protein
MKKLFLALAVAFAVVGGAVAVSALSTTPVAACPQGSPKLLSQGTSR